MFSSRLPARLRPNAVSACVARARTSGAPLLDLTETNPTAVGLVYPDGLLEPLSDGCSLRYQPNPMGLLEARIAVADSYRLRNGRVDLHPGRVVLTASTSEAYSLLFKLLCDPGEEILVPAPSYPLFDLLAGLEGVRAVSYRLERTDGWSINREDLGARLGPPTRAILVVSPNNPTGSFLAADDADWLAQLAADRNLAIVADEVFADYVLSPGPTATSLLGEGRALTFTLGGLSKSAGLPQMKLAWMIASGPGPLVADALERLEIICDTYLSVSTPVQIAAARLISFGEQIRPKIQERLCRNLVALEAHVRRDSALTLIRPEGGWSAVLRVPAILSEEQLVLRLIEDAHVLVHPGYFFDFAEEAFLIVSLLPEPAVFDAALTRLSDVLGGRRA